MSDWTPEVVDAMHKMWLDGKSMSQISAALGNGITRNAVIGKVHRLRWTQSAQAAARAAAGTDTKSASPRAPRPAPAGRSVNVSRLAARPRSVAAALPTSRPAPIAQPQMPDTEHYGSFAILGIFEKNERGAAACKWPVGDPSSHDFRFCGTDRASGPYCAFHHNMAYQPGSAERRRRASNLALPRRFVANLAVAV